MDYVTQLKEEFGTSISHTNVLNGVSCARYWSLILQDVYEKEGISFSFDVLKAKFTIYQHPKSVEDDPMIFPIVARIPDAML